MPRDPRHSIERHQHFAHSLGFNTREVVFDDGEVMVDVTGFGELVELHYRPSKTGYLAFHHAFHHGGPNGDKYWAWWHINNQLYLISVENRCDHFETDTQPEGCTDCVCADCGAWVGSAECRRNEGGRCDKCIAAELDEERDPLSEIENMRDWGDS